MSLKSTEKKEPFIPPKSIAKSSTDAKTRVGTESQCNRNDLRSKELPSHSAHPSDQCVSRWNKLKALREQNVSKFESISKLSPEERAVWRSSKLFSKTLSSVDGIRSTKKGNSSQMSSVTREYSSAELHPKNMTANPRATSPKREVSQSSTAEPAAKQSEWKLLKSKLSSLRKKSNKDMPNNCLENAIITKGIKDVNGSGGGTGLLKYEKSAQFQSILTTESILTSKKSSSEVKGIICKKEDLMHIISKASKVTKTKSFNSEDGDDTNELCATTSTATATAIASTSNTVSADMSIKRNILKKQHSCGSESYEREENNKTKQSNTRTECLQSCEPETPHKNQYQSYVNKTDSSGEECVAQNSQIENSVQNESESRLKNKNKSGLTSKRVVINESNLVDRTQTQIPSNTQNTQNNEQKREDREDTEDNESESNVPAVQWDDINFVDPSLLGDAIQTFLQGLTGSGSTTGSTTNEKRVSFKKSF